MKIDTVEKAMEALNKPCTTREIVDYLLENKLVEPVKWDLKMEISRKLDALKKWEVVDRIMQGHTGNGGHIWYLRKNGAPEHDPKTCKHCIDRNRTFNHHMTTLRINTMKRNVRKTVDNKEQEFEDRW